MTILEDLAVLRNKVLGQSGMPPPTYDRYQLNLLVNWVYEKEKSLKSEIDEKVEAYRATLVTASKTEFDELSKLRDEVNTLIRAEQKRLDDAKVVEASQDPRIGKRYCQWRKGPYGLGRWSPTGLIGVIEVLTSEMQRDLKPQGPGFPSIGDLVIRHLKKDGTHGKRYESLKHTYDWYPEGEDPNVKK